LRDHKKSHSNFFILQLCISNILMLVTIPMVVMETSNNGWLLGEPACKVTSMLIMTSFLSSILFYLVMAIVNSKSIMTSSRVKMLIVTSVWITSFVLASPTIWLATVKGNSPNCYCRLNFNFNITEIDHNGSTCRDISKEQLVYVEDMVMTETDYFDYQDDYSEMYPEYSEESVPDDGYYDEDGNYVYNSDYYEDYSSENYDENNDSTESDYEYSFEDYVEEGSKIPQFIRNVKSCSTSEHEMLQYRISAAIYFFIFYLLPSVMIITFYIKLLRKKEDERSQKINKNENESKEKMLEGGRKAEQRKTQKRPQKLLTPILLSVSFIFFWFPFAVVEVMKTVGTFAKTSQTCDTINFVTKYLTWVQCAIWPLLYNFTATSLSSRVKQLKRLICKKQSSRSKEIAEIKVADADCTAENCEESSIEETRSLKTIQVEKEFYM